MGKFKEKISWSGIIILFLLIFQKQTYAQQEIYTTPGLVSVSATLSPAKMLNYNEFNYYFSAFGEYRFHSHFSVRGDFYYLLKNDPDHFLNENIISSLGIQYLQSFKNFELNMGIAPGFGIMNSYRNTAVNEFVPVIQVNFGVRYYIWKYFHFYANISYFHQQMQNLNRIHGIADELMLSAGLGFNIQTRKN